VAEKDGSWQRRGPGATPASSFLCPSEKDGRITLTTPEDLIRFRVRVCFPRRRAVAERRVAALLAVDKLFGVGRVG
jgi:hypothetical protein